MPQKLTPKLIRKLFPEQNSKEIERLNVSANDIVEVGDLTTCPSLIRLDLSQNSIQDTSFASTCRQIKWLSLANNPIADLGHLQCLKNLQVLNVGHAKLAGKVRIEGLEQLGALILNDNQITTISGLKRLPNLNTLVLKHNAIADLGTCLRKCSGLQKLSMAHNRLSRIGDALSQCTALKELRLNHNALERLPAELAANSQLRILDLGDNPIADMDFLKVLTALPWLRNLNLKGCTVAQGKDYPQSILRLLPKLEVLDNKRVAAQRSSKQPKAATQTGVVAEAFLPHKSDAARRSAQEQAAPPREDRTKSASTSAGVAGLAGKAGKSKAIQSKTVEKAEAQFQQADGMAGPIAEREGAFPGSWAKQKKTGAVSERGGLDDSKQPRVSETAAEGDGAGVRKKQRLQDKDRSAGNGKEAAVSSASGDLVQKAASKLPAPEQGRGFPETSAAHRPPVVGVFDARADAAGKAQKKAAALARGVQAAALLAAEPAELGTASGWSWEAPAMGDAADGGNTEGSADPKISAKSDGAVLPSPVGLQHLQRKKLKKAKKGGK